MLHEAQCLYLKTKTKMLIGLMYLASLLKLTKHKVLRGKASRISCNSHNHTVVGVQGKPLQLPQLNCFHTIISGLLLGQLIAVSLPPHTRSGEGEAVANISWLGACQLELKHKMQY